MHRLKHALAIALLLPGILSAQADISVKATHYGVEHGLSQGSNYFMCKDSRGFHWFSSYEGLNRFDGRKFERFYADQNDAAALKGAEVLGIVEDAHGNLWVGTECCLNRYDRKSGKFSAIFPKDVNGREAFSQTHPFYADSTELWYANDRDGIMRLCLDSREPQVMDSTLKYKIDYHFNFRVYPVKKGEFWMSQAKGLVHVDLNTGRREWYFSNKPGNLAGAPVEVFAFAVAGPTVWIGVKSGLVKLDLRTHKAVPVVGPFDFSKNQIYAIRVDAVGRVWIACAGEGVILYESAKGAFRRLADLLGQARRYVNTNTAAMNYEPIEHILWVNTEPDGLDKITLDIDRIRHCSNDPEEATDLNASVVRCFTEDRHGRIWVGVWGGGVNVFDPRTGRFQYHGPKPGDPSSLPNGTVLGICTDAQGRIWAATEYGLGCYEESLPGTGRWRRFYNRSNPQDDTNANLCMEVCALPDGQMAVGTAAGIYLLDPLTGVFLPIPRPDIHSEMARNMVYDEARHLLYATLHFDGFIAAQNKGGQWGGVEYHLPSFNANGFYLPRHGGDTIWVGTGQGLVCYDLSKRQHRLFTVRDGLPSNCIYGILPDDIGRLWLSTNRGISCFNPVLNTFENFEPDDGCQGYEYNINAFYRASWGELYFGGVNGFDYFHPEKLQRKHEDFPVYLTDFQLKNHSVALDTVIGELKRLVLRHFENTFSIGFTALDWHNEGNVTYRYRLEPYNEDWVVASTGEEIASFVNVPPGDYRFRVQAASQTGEWSCHEAAVEVVIVPAFWQTRWFRFSTLLALGALLFLALNFYFKTRYRLRLAATEKSVEAERLRTRIAQDIHDEVGGSLTKISLAAQVAARLPELGTSELKYRMEKLGADARHAAGQLREIVFAINPDFDSFEEMQAYFQENAREFWSDTHVAPYFDFGKTAHNPVVSPDLKRQLLLIFKEAQHNVAKHSGASNVWLSFKMPAPGRYLLEVKDDGQGFDPTQKNSFTHGLSGMQKRAESIGAALSIHSAPGEGVVVRVEGGF
jgi:signal transduction histidine kinase/ligand-binding sensor domain-containing protein